MIKQILDRDFVLKSARALDARIGGMIVQAEADADAQKVLDAREVDVSELRRAREELQKAIEAEETKLTPDQQNADNYIPSNSILSLVQTALQQYCEQVEPKEVSDKSDEIRGLVGDDDIPAATKELSTDIEGALSGASPDKAINDYELLDAGWLNCVFAIGVRNWRKRRPFNPKPADPYKITNRARVVLFSDWGSGLPRAQKISQQIRRYLDDPEAANRDKHLIHLGDVYYSGWEYEYKRNVLPYWSVKPEEAKKISSWNLNGNHDMYSGGFGYFDYLLRDERFAAQQQSSFFSLENNRWLLLGLDTGYHENSVFDPHDLYGDIQNEWAYQKLKEAAPNKKGILLSHHQPFSAYDEGGEKILEKLQSPLNEGLIHTWFWGHEHRCALYEPRESIKFLRCIGHGGIPFYKGKGALPAGVQYEFRDGFNHLLEVWNYFGFVVLDFEDDQINVRYISEQGDTHHTETIS